ncbi:MAG: SseB family protein [Actinomycetota bacterium]|nr:SseB family protein [Actinomycetota bacterium]
MAGRAIPDPGFAGDTGAADPALAAALQQYAADPTLEARVVAALASARVLVPVVAVLDEQAEVAPGELRREKSTDMALATLVGTDGRRALPVFTSLATLARWDPQARPVPVPARRAAESALHEGTDVLVIDVAGPVPYVLPGPLVRALAVGRELIPLYEDPRVRATVRELLSREPAVAAAHLLPAAGVDARLGLVLDEDAPPARVADVATRVATGLRDAPALRAAVLRGLDVALLPAGALDGVEATYVRSAVAGTAGQP